MQAKVTTLVSLLFIIIKVTTFTSLHFITAIPIRTVLILEAFFWKNNCCVRTVNNLAYLANIAKMEILQ